LVHWRALQWILVDVAKVEIPQFFKDNVSRLMHPVEEGSHEPIPSLPTIAQQRLMIDLTGVSGTLLGTKKEPADQVVAFDAAYTAFASAFVDNGALLTPGLLELDIPNMVFNFALHEDWFTSVGLYGDKSEGYELLSPKRYPKERILSRVFAVHASATVGWFTKAIQPSVARWKMKLIEAQIQSHGESQSDDESHLKNYRAELLADYKRRVTDENGKKISDYALYNARGHTMHKPQFQQWKCGSLSVEHPATVTFERFLKGDKRPIPRKLKE
jgi:hypothetical protein